MIILLAGPAVSTAEPWYVGGTLHQATVTQWRRAPYANRLATAASWALMQPGVRKISRKSSTMDTVKPYALELTGCMDKMAAGRNQAAGNAASLAAACMLAMGW